MRIAQVCCEKYTSSKEPHPICDWLNGLINTMSSDISAGTTLHTSPVRRSGRDAMQNDVTSIRIEDYALNLMQGALESVVGEDDGEQTLRDFFTDDLVSFVFDSKASDKTKRMRMLAMADTLAYLVSPDMVSREFQETGVLKKEEVLAYLVNPSGKEVVGDNLKAIMCAVLEGDGPPIKIENYNNQQAVLYRLILEFVACLGETKEPKFAEYLENGLKFFDDLRTKNIAKLSHNDTDKLDPCTVISLNPI